MMLALSRRDYVNTIVKVEHEERLKEALAKGCGVIAVTAHFGNFPLMMLYLARRGYASSCIIRPARDEKMEEFLKAKRTEQELKTIYAIPRHTCVVESLKVLRQKEVLFIPVDQNMGAKGGVFVNFFGREASTPTGPVVFARRSGAVILPMFMIRQADGTHKIIIEKPLKLVEGKDETETLRINMQNMTEIVERYIRLYPGQWAWMHRRWKTQPDTNQMERAEEVL